MYTFVHIAESVWLDSLHNFQVFDRPLHTRLAAFTCPACACRAPPPPPAQESGDRGVGKGMCICVCRLIESHLCVQLYTCTVDSVDSKKWSMDVG